MGIIFHTDKRGVKVWRSDRGEKPTYAVQVSKKEGDTWLNKYQRIRFKGSPDIKNGTIVHIDYGFEALDSWVKDGAEHTDIVLIATDYSYEGMKEHVPQSFLTMPDLPDTFSASEDEIPF